MKKTAKQLQGEETKARLLKNAVQMIRERGYNNVSVSQICRQSKTAKGTFYLYFKSKTDILFEILNQVNEVMFSEKTWDETLPPKEKLKDYCSYYLETVTQQGYETSREIFKIIMDESPDPFRINSFKHAQRIRKILREGVETNVFTQDYSIDEMGNLLQEFLFGSILAWCSSSGKYNIHEKVMSQLDIILNGFLIHY